MPLSEHEKTEARDAIALALELNEPEAMIEGLRRLCERKEQEPHISDNERNRWSNARAALTDVAIELERALAALASANDANAAPGEQSSDS